MSFRFESINMFIVVFNSRYCVGGKGGTILYALRIYNKIGQGLDKTNTRSAPSEGSDHHGDQSHKCASSG